MKNFIKLFIFAAAVMTCNCAYSETAIPIPQEKYEISLVSIFEGSSTEYIFVVGKVGFKSVESLKTFLGSRPKGTEVTWSPGCLRNGGEPLLSSKKDMDDFKSFLGERGIKLIIVPAG